MRNQMMTALALGCMALLGAGAAQAGEMMKDGMKHERGMMDKAMHKMHESKSMDMSEKHMNDGMMKNKGKDMDKKDGMSDNMDKMKMDKMKKNKMKMMHKDMHKMMHDKKDMMHDH